MDEYTLGERIAAKRKERHMTQAELGAVFGISDKAVSKWERELTYPDVTLLIPIAELFCISLDDLFGRGCR